MTPRVNRAIGHQLSNNGLVVIPSTTKPCLRRRTIYLGDPQRALADTSVFIGHEAAQFDVSRFENFEWGVSAIALGELRLGVLKYRACMFSLESSCL